MSAASVGFTGTRNEPTDFQKKKLFECLRLIREDYDTLHHGGSVGADHVAHIMALHLKFKVVIHPGPAFDLNLWPLPYDILPQLPNLERNVMIVQASTLLLAVPHQRKEIIRSGTWATVRYARKRDKEIEIIWP